MSEILQIQPAIHCEPCKECGARPVIKQSKGKYIVMCPTSKRHYQTKPGLVDVNDWNVKNKVHQPLGDHPSQKAS